MNVYSNITLEVARNNYTYRFEIPFGAAYADAEQVAQDMAKHVAEMARIAIENAPKPQENSPEESNEQAPCAEPCLEADPVSE